MSIDHALVCHKGGYTITHHNALRDLNATLLREVCSDTSTEPPLQPLSGEGMELLTANCDQEARLDIKVIGYWCVGQEAFCDVRVFHPNASSYSSRSLKSIYPQHKQEKKRCYGQWVGDVERAAFTLLVFSSTGGMAIECTTFYKCLGSMIAKKRKLRYQYVITWLRCKITSTETINHGCQRVKGWHVCTLLIEFFCYTCKLPIILQASHTGACRKSYCNPTETYNRNSILIKYRIIFICQPVTSR